VLRTQSPETFGLSLPLIPVVHDTVELRNKKFVRFTCFVFPCAQLASSMRNGDISRLITDIGSVSSGVDGAGNICMIGRALVAAGMGRACRSLGGQAGMLHNQSAPPLRRRLGVTNG
jgi:hypothetical protein